jgi:hypothetical protein
MSAFEYKTQEEVLTVIKHLTALLSTIGMQLVDIVSPADLLAQLHGPSNNMDVDQVELLPLSKHPFSCSVRIYPRPPRLRLCPVWMTDWLSCGVQSSLR